MLLLPVLVILSAAALPRVTPLSSFEERDVHQKVSAKASYLPNKYNFLDDYHFPMVADEVRNQLYFAALQKAIVPNRSKVLDVGAGTMLLSMMAKDLGAHRVLGVEANPLMCEVAREVLRVNGYTNDSSTGSVRLYEGLFETFGVGDNYGGKPADVFVSETFDAALIGENFLSILTHAKTHKLIKKKAKIIPHSATIFGQLLESTFSLPPPTTVTNNKRSDSSYHALGKYNLEPMRRHRPADVFTVRYLDEENAVRKRLSPVMPLFDLNFQEFDVSTGHFAYNCVIFHVTEDGMFDSIGIWFKLFLDADKTLVLSNAPASLSSSCQVSAADEECSQTRESTASCWMQALYRVSTDVPVKRGDVLRLQMVQLSKSLMFGKVGNGLHNSNSRLIKFIAVGCSHDVNVYAYGNDEFVERIDATLSNQDMASEYLFGTIPSASSISYSKKTTESFKVFSAHVFQLFKLVSRGPSGKKFGMMYQLPDSTQQMEGSAEELAQRYIPLDEYRLTCPSQ